MENSIKRKINLFGKVAKIITTILIVFLLVAEGFMLVGGIVVACVPKDSVTVDAAATADVRVDTAYFGLDEGKVSAKIGGTQVVFGDVDTGELQVTDGDGSVNLSGDFKNLHFDLNDALLLIVYGFISLACIVVALFFFKALMKEFMTCDSPFSDGVVKKMRSFAIALIPCVAVAQAMKSAMGGIISNSFAFDFDFVSIAFVLIIFVLTMIFKYGTELQKEHDETV